MPAHEAAAFSAFILVMDDNSSREAEVSSKDEACCEAFSESDSLLEED